MKCMPFWKGCNRNIDFIDQRHRGLTKVPDDVERYSQTLEELLLDSNQIRELPKSLFRLEQLRKLTLSDNQLTRLTADFASLVNLQELDVSKNEITQVTESIKHCKNLQVLDMSNNPLQDIPSSISCLKNLTHLSLNDSSITRLPHDIGSLTNLESLEIRENFIQQLPDSIGELANLRILDVGNNAIDCVPDSISLLTNLQELRMDCNDISEITSDVGNLKKLTELDLSENKLEKLPQEVGQLSCITDLYLSQNQLEYLPDGIGNLKKLTTLKLDQNRLVQLTSSIGNCVSLQELILTENMLADLPSTIGKLKNLSILMTDKNKLSGIPPKIGGCVKLGVLSMRDNCVWRLPPELGFLKELHVLDVSGNRLQHLPMSLNSCNLKALWLSENQAQPLLKFQQDIDEETGDKVLTCFLLPQQAYTDSMENILKDSFAPAPENDGRSLWTDHSRSLVKFAEDAHESDSDDETTQLNGKPRQEVGNHFVRHNTPHPKDLRVRHNKMFEKNVDGHMIPHKPGKNRDSNSNFEASEISCLQDQADLLDNIHKPWLSNAQDYKINKAADVAFSPVEQNLDRSPLSDPNNFYRHHSSDDYSDVKREDITLRIVRQPGIGLGISIAGGLGSVPYVDEDEGIFVSKVNSSGAAEKCGVNAGDKVISVNGKSMVGIEHIKAVEILKLSGNDMNMVVSRKKFDSPNNNQNYMGLASTTQLNSASSLVPNINYSTHQLVSSPSSSEAHLLQAQWTHLQPSSSSSFLTNPQSLLSSLSSPSYQLPSSLSSPSQFLPPIVSSPEQSNGGLEHNNTLVLNNYTNKNHNNRNISQNSNCHSSVTGDNEADKLITSVSLQDQSKQTYPMEDIRIIKINGALGLSIVGGVGHTSLPFGTDEPGIFISKITKLGAASKTHLRVGDRLLTVNDVAMTNATHQDAVSALVSSGNQVNILVRHDPQPPGLKEVVLRRGPGEPLGLTIMGGEGAQDEGIFISKIQPDSPATKTGLLKPGQRILEVNGRTLLGVSQNEAISVFSNDTSDTFNVLVCDGLDMPSSTTTTTTTTASPTFPHPTSRSSFSPTNPITPLILSHPPSSSSALPTALQNGVVNVIKITLPSVSSVPTSTTAHKTSSCIERLDAIISEMNHLAGPSFLPKPVPLPKPLLPPPLPSVLQNIFQMSPQNVENFGIKNSSSSMDDLLSPSSPSGRTKLDRKVSLDTGLRPTYMFSSHTKKVSSEEDRRIRAEQRRQARLQFLEGATHRVHDSLVKSHDILDFKPPF